MNGSEPKAFHTAEFAKLTRAQRDAYEQSVMDYIGVREVAVTAREELIVRMYQNGIDEELIARIAELSVEKVRKIIDGYSKRTP